MENIIKQIRRGAKHTSLSVAEKAEIKSGLLRYMKANPVREGVISSRAIPSPFSISNFRNKKSISILVIGGLLMGGSVSFAAENTVPGDMLFMVKVRVNENVRGAVAISPIAKAQWEVRLVERRLEEVEKLAIMPNALPEAQQLAQENLVNYSQYVKERIERFEEDEDGENAMETALRFSGVLSAHEYALYALATGHASSTLAFTGSVATTTTPSAVASSIATNTMGVVATTTSATTLSQKDARALLEVLGKIHEVRGSAEEKHKELKKKYHQEDADDEDGEDDSDVSGKQLIVASSTITRATLDNVKKKTKKAEIIVATSTLSTTSAKTFPVLYIRDKVESPKTSSEKKKEETRKENRTRREEVRATPVISATSTTTRARTETKKIDNDD